MPLNYLKMFSVKTKIIFGRAEEEISDLNLNLKIKGNGLLCTRRSANFKFNGLNLYHLKISPEPCVDDIYKYFDKIRDLNFDYVLAIGGGSVLDAAKILSVMDKDRKVEGLIGMDKVKGRIKTLIAIPTTHGSGSEVTKYAVLKFQGLKQTVVSDFIVPDYALIDENLVMNQPAELTFYTSIDAFCHNIEAYLSKVSHPLTDLNCVNGMKFFFDGIDAAMENKISGRKKMLVCSVLGGIAITNIRTNLIHALSHVVGAEKEISHGLANALFLRGYLKFYKGDEKFKKLGKILNIDIIKRTDEIYEKYNTKQLCDFAAQSEIRHIAELTYENKRLLSIMKKEISKEEIERIVAEAM
ncbi:MAG: hypothetical protein COV98_05095 [Candidatus Altarchaeum sp. CG12_big_fil_rev_8_21_14_0_65_33_22]|nr:MAG: hypothetical protein COV98_05095 [Candidatus Altarchaeum sp. CG12_big_fil_rev_8_21_14_0_65_33_22]PIV27938.1 MAG: hypothetical protein COS36_03975 [Candidatus Altarchaeum sp. CG03_land_8_20_14_0_80_32_618]PIX49244.1 MAG: hypothetical protein COZ53_01200 [Candidatus Altarchaeum sp. CG_4_8_14_3_um_filter_33_2054]PJC14677.1 MAG: hypothetical protein CO063_02390 [Candidatus Altarchaeum sp. CG_4_9_14_0_8_um_filter_32_206]